MRARSRGSPPASIASTASSMLRCSRAALFAAAGSSPAPVDQFIDHQFAML
jgi:hypothetical protein